MAYSPDGKDGQPLNNEEHNKDAKTNGNPDSFKDVSLDAMTFNVFFDGTGNNMFNTEFREKDEKTSREAWDKAEKEGKSLEDKYQASEQAREHGNLRGEISFDNELSNPALLYKAAHDNNTTIRRIYIEGAGTIRGQIDDNAGLAAAAGPSGIMDRVYDAYNQISKILEKIKKIPTTLIFNVFGFSRGSFYGRYFVALLKQDPKIADHNPGWITRQVNKVNSAPVVPALTNDKARQSNGRLLLEYDPDNIRVNLVGIYDTVASHGWDHFNDSIDFQLDIGNKQDIAKVIHLTANNEYRNHFALVETNTAISQTNKQDHPTGFQCSMPGSHADISGGYIAAYPENNMLLSNYEDPFLTGFWGTTMGEVNWRWYREMGYYSSNQAKYKEIYSIQRDLEATRAVVNANPELFPPERGDPYKEKNEELIAIINKKDEVDPEVPKKQGSYGEFSIETSLSANGYNYQVRGDRIVNGNAYQFIPLEAMHEIAQTKFKAVTFDNPEGLPLLTTAFAAVKADPILVKFRDHAIPLILSRCDTDTKLDLYMKDAMTYKESRYIYHNYIHNSLAVEFVYGNYGKQIFSKYMTNGSRNYNKDKSFTPIRVRIADNQVGVINERENN